MDLLHTITSALVGVAATLWTQRNAALRDLRRTWQPIYLKVDRNDPDQVTFSVAVNQIPIIWDVWYLTPVPGQRLRRIGKLRWARFQVRRLAFKKKGYRLWRHDDEGRPLSVHASKIDLPTVAVREVTRFVWGEPKPRYGWLYWNDETAFAMRRAPLPVIWADEDPVEL